MKKAFTLVEIILVVLILAVVAGSAVPSFQRSYARQKLSQAADNMVYLMRYARSRVISEGAYLKMHVEGQRVSLTVASVDARGEPETFAPVTGTLGRRLELPQGIEFEKAPEDMLFHSDGRMDPVTFSIVGEAGRYTISTREMPGHVLVREE